MIGSTLSHFKITAKLGEGGMGEVYRAEDTKLGREVAIKVLPDALAADPCRRDRFEREARTLAALDHPGIVHIYSVDSAVVDGREVLFLTMQLVRGQTLADLIQPGGLPVSRIFAIASPLADALAAAHRSSVVHRDLKPGNVMVTEDGRVQVLDFGLAKWRQEAAPSEISNLPTEPLTKEGSIIGTVPYMSPEQLEGKELDARSDLFSLGVILYEMATGTRPFRGDSSASLISSIMKDSPEDIDRLREDLPHHLGRITRRCLEKDPDRRYQSAIDVRNDLLDLERELESGVESREALPEPHPEMARTAHQRSRPRRLFWTGMAALAVLLVALVVWMARQQSGVETRETTTDSVTAPALETASIAVLPFVDMSPDRDQEYFSDGLTDELLNLLVQVDDLKVAARSSSFSFKNKEVDITRVAEDLGVTNILEGSVRKAGDRIRVTAQLVNARDGFQLWSDSYDRELDDIFALQDDIANAVVGSLQLTLLGSETGKTSSRSQSIDAYNLYLQGRFYAQRRSGPEDFERAIDCLEQAVELDPEYALAWAGLAYARNNQAGFGYIAPDIGLAEAMAAIEKALKLEPDLAYGWAILGEIRNELEWDWQGASDALQKAVALRPDDPEIMRRRAELAISLGDLDQAIELAKQAASLEPLNWLPLTVLALAYEQAGRWEEALATLTKIQAIRPEYRDVHMRRARIELGRGRPDQALGHLDRVVDEDEVSPFLAMALHGVGRSSEAQDLLRAAAADAETSPMRMVEAYAYMNEPDLAFEWIDRAIESHDGALVSIKKDPLLANLHDDPRWPAFLERMGLAD